MASQPLRFITFEGGEGGGKSTQLRALGEALRATGADVVTTREPGGAPGAEEIRRLLVEGEPGRWPSEAEALLHFAARAEHLDKVIRPALNAGKWVLCDRFADSTRVYQGVLGHVDMRFINALERIDQTVLPNLSRLLEGVLESAALARPGVDALHHADALRHSAAQVAQLTELIGAVAQRPMIRA